MRTLPLRRGSRVPVVAAEWYDAFGVVTRGQVQLELRDGELGPVLGRDAGFWLRGTGVRALRNPGRRTAMVRIVTPGPRPSAASQHTPHVNYRVMENDMDNMNDAGLVAGPASGPTSRARRETMAAERSGQPAAGSVGGVSGLRRGRRGGGACVPSAGGWVAPLHPDAGTARG